MKRLREFARRHLLADAAPLSAQERWRSALAALLGMLLIEAILAVLPAEPSARYVLAPLGASSVILFALPHSPLGQPWSLAGGLMISALIGSLCGHWLNPPWLAIPAALAASVWLMAWLRCLHPPGGAMAVLFAAMTAQPSAGLDTALFNTLAALVAAFAVNGLIPGRRWPQGAPESAAPRARAMRTGIRHEDLQHALAEIDGFLDISEEDLVRVYDLALGHAHQRHERRRCGDIMSTEVVSVEYGTELNQAWRLLRRHRHRALPVVDAARRVIGLIASEHFVAHVAPDSARSVADNLRTLLRPSPTPYSEKPEVVGQLMTDDIVVARASDPIGRIARLLAEREHPPAVPVVDDEGRLAGILSQTDLLAALYHRGAAASAASAHAPA